MTNDICRQSNQQKPLLLITFGCSWTYGVGVAYCDGMDEHTLRQHAWNQETCNSFSWRGLISHKLHAKNINFSWGGSSNQRQFRLAKNFFSDPNTQNLIRNNDVLVVWGITSVVRNELFDSKNQRLRNFFLTDNSPLSRCFMEHSYNTQHEIFNLAQEISHWNVFFKNSGIKNYWFDTFNHHEYDQAHPGLDFYKSAYKKNGFDQYMSWQDFGKHHVQESATVRSCLDATHRWYAPDWKITSLLARPNPDNLILANHQPRDLMSQMALSCGAKDLDDRYHISDWTIDTNRIELLVEFGLINPISHHPTQAGHRWIADFLLNQIVDGQNGHTLTVTSNN